MYFLVNFRTVLLPEILESNYLMTTDDNCFGAIVAFKDALHVVTFACRTPVRLFRVIWFHGILPLHVKGNNKVWTRILIWTRTLLDVTRHVCEISWKLLEIGRFFRHILKAFVSEASYVLHFYLPKF